MTLSIYQAVPAEKLKRFIRLLYYEQTHYRAHDMPLSHRLRLYRNGLLSRADSIYDFGNHRPEEYVSDFDRHIRAYKLNKEFEDLLSNKLATHKIFDEYSSNFPKVYGVIDEGWYFTESDTVPTNNIGDVLQELLLEYGSIVIKGITGSAGREVMICKQKNDAVVVNNTKYRYQTAADKIQNIEPALVSEFIAQHEYADALYPDSVNTIRILTMVDPEIQEPFIAIAVQRIGTDQTGGVDNFSQGGLSSEIDINSGELSKAAQVADRTLQWYSKHPNSGAKIEGETVPFWEETKEKIITMAAKKPYLRYAGWDVVITADGKQKIIEVNTNSDVDLLQVHRPLLADNRVKRFYDEYNII